MKRNLMRLLGIAIAIGALTLITSGVASASKFPTPAPISSASNATGNTVPPPSPNGCNQGFFCSYNKGNGGDLCFQANWSDNYPSGCADANDGAFNNTTADDTRLHYEFGYNGAYYQLGPGHYLLYMSQNYFNACFGGGTACDGYGRVMQNNVESVYFFVS